MLKMVANKEITVIKEKTKWKRELLKLQQTLKASQQSYITKAKFLYS